MSNKALDDLQRGYYETQEANHRHCMALIELCRNLLKNPQAGLVSPSNSSDLLCAVIELFKGIDEMEGDSPDGWWETSTGAEFGAKKLAELIKIIGI